MTFSIIIPTRNRPGLLRRAIMSVQAQSFRDFEVIVVDDGSSPAKLAETEAVVRELGERVRLHALPARPGGHGPAFSRNTGVELAGRPYLAFLDDDDEWIDPEHLARVAALLQSRPGGFDLHLADQVAVRGAVTLAQPIWTEDLHGIVTPPPGPGSPATYELTLAQLMQSGGFNHLNTTIVRRAFFIGLGRFDESLRYESDRDFALRAADAAGLILYTPLTVARHYAPDRARTDNVSTALDEANRRLHQLRLLDKAALFARSAVVRAYGRRHKAYTLKRLAASLAGSGDLDRAWFYAREAALLRFSPRWAGYAAWLGLRHLASRKQG